MCAHHSGFFDSLKKRPYMGKPLKLGPPGVPWAGLGACAGVARGPAAIEAAAGRSGRGLAGVARGGCSGCGWAARGCWWRLRGRAGAGRARSRGGARSILCRALAVSWSSSRAGVNALPCAGARASVGRCGAIFGALVARVGSYSLGARAVLAGAPVALRQRSAPLVRGARAVLVAVPNGESCNISRIRRLGPKPIGAR